MKFPRRSTSVVLCVFILIITCISAGAVKANDSVYLGGMPFGVRFFTGKLTVNGFGEVDSAGGSVSPAKEAGFCENDIILEVDGKGVRCADDVTSAVINSGGKELQITVERSNETLTISVKPVLSESAGEYRIGLWMKDGTAGIGTVTYILPETGAFAGLGHGICDSTTGELCDINKGIVSDVSINGVKQGVAGEPGELKGIFAPERSGIVKSNTDHGVFGVLSDSAFYENEPIVMPIGTREDLKDGAATIYCTVDGDKIECYNAKITKQDGGECPPSSFVIEITDKELIEKTGGIVQGM